MKKILFSVLVVVIVFMIYYFNISEKVYYLSIGDYLAYGINNLGKVENNYSDNIVNKYKNKLSNYVNYSTVDDYRVMDLYNDIIYNKIVNFNNKEYKIQNLLIKANLITISIGMNDLIYKKNITYDYVDELLNDIDNLLKLIRKYNKDKICVLGFYDIINNKDLIDYTNKRLESICKKNKINYVEINKLNNYIINDYPTNSGYTYILEKILNFTNL